MFPKNISWLPLQYYDDTTFDNCSNELMLEKHIELNVQVRALTRYKSVFSWKPAELYSYDPLTEKFHGKFQDDSNEFQLPRLFIWFTCDSPLKMATRIRNAQERRIYADSIIRYNYFIENMLNHEAFDLDANKRNRLEKLALNTHALEGMDTTALLLEVNHDYAKTMNGLLFDKYLQKGSDDLIPHNLILPEINIQNEIKYYGLIETENRKGTKEIWMYNHNEVFSNDVKY